MASAKFSGSDGYILYADIGRSGDDITVDDIDVVKQPGYTGQYTSSDYEWVITVSGGSGAKGEWSYDFRGNTGGRVTETVTSDKTFDRSGGSFKVTVTVRAAFGTATITQTVTIPSKPSAPSSLGVDQATPTSLRYRYKLNSSGGSAITRTEVRYSENKNMSGAKLVKLGAKTTQFILTNADPDTAYYFQSRAVNSYGASDWSAVSSGKTATATAPSIVVTPQPSGTSARVTISPPRGATGITQYQVQARIGEGPALTWVVTVGEPTGPSGSAGPPGNTLVNGGLAGGLTPGATYRWRVQAIYGPTYSGPFSAYVTQTQPRPNTNPGDYFDGSLVPSGFMVNNFAWAGTAHASQSIVYAMKVLGWHAVGDPGYDGTFALHRFRGGFFGDYAAHIIFRTSPSIPGLHIGMNPGVPEGRADVFGGERYTGSMFVETSQAQLMQLEILWLDNTDAVIATTTSAPTLIPAETVVRMSATDFAPEDAIAASVRVFDVIGSVDPEALTIDWQPWRSGDYVTVDGAMVSLGDLVDYFDGATLDDLYYRYDWLGATNASVSSRTALGYEENLLVDPDCEPVPPAPQPPAIPTDCIVETGEWRRLAFQVNEGDVRLWSTSVPTFSITTDLQAARQIRIRTYANPDGVAPEALDPTGWESEMIVSYLPPKTHLTLDGVTESAYAEVAGRESRSANHLLFGTDGVPAEWPELRCGVGYVITMDVPTDNAEDNLQVEMTLTQRM